MKGRCPLEVKSAIVLALGLGISSASLAATLGPIYVNSYMGQPLNATIPMSSLTAVEAQNSRITLASAAEYNKRGVIKTPEQSAISFRLVPNGNSYNIAVVSNKNIDEPFVNFVLSFTAGNEILTREYSVFLDPEPPASAGIKSIAQKNSVTLNAEPNTTIAPASSEKQGWGDIPAGAKHVDLTQQLSEIIPAESKPAVNVKVRNEHQRSSQNYRVAHADPRLVNGNKYGPVKSGETLYSIAKMVRPSADFPVHIMMRAIFNSNQHAFVRGNIDNLMAGQTLTIPSDIRTASTTKLPNTQRDHNNQSAIQEKKNELLDSKPETDSQLSDILNKNNSDELIQPAEMTLEEIAKAEEAADELEANALAEEKFQVLGDGDSPSKKIENTSSLNGATLGEKKDTSEEENADASMILDGLDSVDDTINNMENQETEVVIEVPQETIAKKDDTTDSLLREIEPEVSSETTLSTAPIENSLPADSASGLPFGLKLWHLLLAGSGILALIILGLFANKKKNTRMIEEADLSEEEVDTLALEMMQNENNLATSHSDEFDTFDEEEYLPDQLSPEDEQFFADASTTADDFTADNLPEDISQLDKIDDFFAEDVEITDDSFNTTNDSTLVETDFDLDDLDDFFADDSNLEPQHSASTAEAAGFSDLHGENDSKKAEESDFSGLDEFFDDDIQSTSLLEEVTPPEDNISDDDFNFFTDDFTETISDSSDEIISTEIENESQLDLLDDVFFADSINDKTNIIEDSIKNITNELSDDDLLSLEISTDDTIERSMDDLASDGLLHFTSDDESAFFADTSDEEELLNNDLSIDLSNDSNNQSNTFSEKVASEKPITVKSEVPSSTPSEADIQAMGINLDLADAYIKSGVKPEKARMWLQEVIMKGTDTQKNQANELLKKIS